MEPFSNLADAQRFIEQRVYERFRDASEWPIARDLDLDYHELLDPLGGLQAVCQRIGPDRIWCGSPASEHDRVVLRRAALMDLPDAREDLANFLAIVRLGADRYHSSRGRDPRLQVSDVVQALGINESAAQRALELVLSDDGVASGGGGGTIQFSHVVSRMRGVRSLEDYQSRLEADAQRRVSVAQQTGLRPRAVEPQMPRRVFLSHAADDAALAYYLANVLRSGAQGLDVFVASKAGDIPTGADWLHIIEAELRQADTYVLLLTPRSVRRFWLWYETGAAWMTERRLVPLTAAGLAKSEVPYPLGARQALSLEDPADVEQLTRDLSVVITDPASFCTTVKELSKALPYTVATPFTGVTVAERYFDWDGPLHKLDLREPVPAPDGLEIALRAAGVQPDYVHDLNARQALAGGFIRLFETDRQTWKREILQPGSGRHSLFVRPS